MLKGVRTKQDFKQLIREIVMKAFAGALAIAVVFAFSGTAAVNACGGMTTVNPPPLTLDDPVDPPVFDEEDPVELGDGECIL
jgi:hypothetical protein